MNAITEVPNGALLSFIERAAKDETFDVAKFETLLRVRRDEAHDHARRVFNQAMAICQSEMLPVLRSTANKGVGGKYAKLEDIDQQMRPIYTSHGFSVRFGSAPPPQPGWLRITCTVAHESGYFEENYLDSPVSNQGAQGGRMAMTPVQAVGSVVTYLRRYLLGMVFNIVQADVVGEDDDGEGMRRAAAAATPRAARVAERAPAYEAPPRPHPMMPKGPVDPNPVAPAYEAPPGSTHVQGDIYDQHNIAIELLDVGDSQTWLANLEMLLAEAQSQEAVVTIGGCDSVKRTIAKAPGAVKARVSELLASAYKRFAEPADEDLGEVEIEGEEKASA